MAQSNCIFSQLKRLASTIERERETLQSALHNAGASKEDLSNAVITMREIQQDSRRLKKGIQETFNSLKADKTFDELLQLVEVVVGQEIVREAEVESYLQHYGYTPHADWLAAEQESKKKSVSKKKSDKENVPPVLSPNVTSSDSKPDSTLRTPQKSTNATEMERTKSNRTPTLADFGISADTIDALAKGSTSQICSRLQMDFLAPVSSTAQGPAQPLRPQGPMRTPLRFAQSVPMQVTPGIGLAFTDSPVAPVFQTPGIKQIRKQRLPSPPAKPISLQLTEDTAEDSPIPPVLQTPGIRQIKKMIPDKPINANPPHVAPVSASLNTPEAPDVTIRFENLTGTMATIGQADGSYMVPPQAPQLLSDPTSMPEPVAPVTLSETIVQPSTPESLASKLNLDELSSPTMPQLTGVYNFNTYSLTENTDLDQPKETPEETRLTETSGVKQISPITCDEYCNQVDYIQRQLSMEYANLVIDKINEFVTNKCTDGFEEAAFTETELKVDIGLGYKTKAMLLLLTRLQRVHCTKARGLDVYWIL